MKVLAVDDNRTNLHILQVFLKKLGHQPILAENGEQAVRSFVEEKPDLVLLDIMMPVMDGFEAARQIKAMHRERWTPIIFLSALNRDENLVEGLDAGADDYLTKPINFVVLEAKLRSVQRSLDMQQASIEALRRVQAISDNVPDAIVTLEQDGRIATVNMATERIFGWRASEIVGQDIRMLIPDARIDDAGPSQEGGQAVKRGSAMGYEREEEATHRSGQRFPVVLGISQVELDNRPMFIGLIRDITMQKQAESTLRENARQLQAYYDRTQSEQLLAKRLMDMQLHRHGLSDSRLHYKVIAAADFSGDIVAAAHSSEGRFYVLLADATGHGLSAAISALPVLAIFYRLARNNHSLRELILELNQQLKESMPVGRFVAATLLCLDENQCTGEIWVGGTPTAFLLDRQGNPAQSFPSTDLPLGIVGNEDMEGYPVNFTWEKDSQLVLCSDGLLESTNAEGVQFGVEGLLCAAANSQPGERFERIEKALAAHLHGAIANDDVSLMLVDCPNH